MFKQAYAQSPHTYIHTYILVCRIIFQVWCSYLHEKLNIFSIQSVHIKWLVRTHTHPHHSHLIEHKIKLLPVKYKKLNKYIKLHVRTINIIIHKITCPTDYTQHICSYGKVSTCNITQHYTNCLRPVTWCM